MRITFITNPHDCNQSCDICFSKQAPLDWECMREMDFAVIEKTVQAFLPLGLKEIIPSTIGEPFLYSHFESFLKLAEKYSIKVNITTNGTFPNGGIKKWMPLLLPVLSDIKFSTMHGKLPEWLRKNILEFTQEIKNHAAKYKACGKPTVSIQATLDENDTLDEIPDGVDRVKINKSWILNKAQSAAQPQLAAGNCPFLGREAWVWVDGTFQVCPNPDARFGMQTKFPFGDFGNFAEQDPLSIWNGIAYRNFCENYKENVICRGCGFVYPKPHKFAFLYSIPSNESGKSN